MSEHQQQCAVVEWASWQAKQYPELELLFAIPNGGARSKAVAGKLKAEGVKPGMPDLMLPVQRPPVAGLFIEMKDETQKGSCVTKTQRKMHQRLQRAGYRVCVCWSATEAIAELQSYLGMRRRLNAT